MSAIRLYHHPECERCRKFARILRGLDWLGRLEIAAAPPAETGGLRPGQVYVREIGTGALYTGVPAFRLLCRHIPAYALGRPLLYLPRFRAYIERTYRACEPAGRVP